MAEPGPFRSPASAVRFCARLLCWSLAAAMAGAAVDAFGEPRAGWWGAVWPLPWWIFGAAALAWAVLRAREKADPPPPPGCARGDWEQAA
ncbi:hypothetical protein [Streptomyces dubilierae]|uniref:Uncharacterized protein n=1 Tax=Streptomyces dubilierae TaxID=3075533 RepID=A0ABU2PKB8_9ACTN|nr:hypothetical protein [Streptomyces sp. DSM 41921]MDT0392272.1 hypothetical protein [Streptomyces sp. DSM 41921]